MSIDRRKMLQIVSVGVGATLIPAADAREAHGAAAQSAAPPAAAPAAETEKVTGIGGFFFRAKDPKALGLWYQQHLGVTLVPSKEGDPVWQQEPGPTAFAPFPETTKYFGDATKNWLLNFRVRDLDKMAAQLQAAGIEIKMYPPDPTGKFGRIHDPEGNPIELWQPAAK